MCPLTRKMPLLYFENMKRAFFLVPTLCLFPTFFVSPAAHATVDCWDQVTLVARDPEDKNEFVLKEFPFSSCLGIAHFNKAEVFASVFPVVQVGCDDEATRDANVLSCARVSYTERFDYKSLAQLTLDLRPCDTEVRKNPYVRKLAQKAVRRNFGLSGSKLTILD